MLALNDVPLHDEATQRSKYKKDNCDPPIKKEELKILYDECESLREVGKKLGIDTVTVLNWMKWYKLERKKKGHIPWNKGKKNCHTKNHREQISNSLKEYYSNHKHVSKGKTPSSLTRLKISKRRKELISQGWIPWNKNLSNTKTRNQVKNAIKSNIGREPWNKGMRTIKLCNFCGKEYVGSGKKYCSRSCRDKAKIIRVERECVFCGKIYTTRPSGKKLFCSVYCRNLWLFMHKVSKKPTKPEKIMINIIKENNLPFKYTGKTLINRKFSVDFLSYDGKIAIEVFGCRWHGCPKCFPNKNLYEKNLIRLQLIESCGINTIVIWEHELKDKSKIIKILEERMEEKELIMKCL